MARRMAPADLRGYGDSGKPAPNAAGLAYSEAVAAVHRPKRAGGRCIVSHIGAFYIMRTMEREAAESAVARRPRVPSRRPDDHAALDVIRSNLHLNRGHAYPGPRCGLAGPGVRCWAMLVYGMSERAAAIGWIARDRTRPTRHLSALLHRSVNH
jgi:hypothetical protein